MDINTFKHSNIRGQYLGEITFSSKLTNQALTMHRREGTIRPDFESKNKFLIPQLNKLI